MTCFITKLSVHAQEVSIDNYVFPFLSVKGTVIEDIEKFGENLKKQIVSMMFTQRTLV